MRAILAQRVYVGRPFWDRLARCVIVVCGATLSGSPRLSGIARCDPDTSRRNCGPSAQDLPLSRRSMGNAMVFRTAACTGGGYSNFMDRITVNAAIESLRPAVAGIVPAAT